jgi:RIO-like serine/threonine protein kinase
MDRVWVAPSFVEACQRLGLHSTEDFARFFTMEAVRGKKSVELRSGKIEEVPVFYKQYNYEAGSWRYLGRKSKARREFLSYEMMERAGVSSATRVACGERRDRLGRLQRAFVVTVTIPDARPLAEFVAAHGQGPGARELRNSLVRQMAQLARRAHVGRFVHRDLWVRNILVNWEDGKAKVWWIDSPKGGMWWLIESLLMDLASLDKGGKEIFSRTERMRFLSEYLGTKFKRLGKKSARKVVEYRVKLEKRGGKSKSVGEARSAAI